MADDPPRTRAARAAAERALIRVVHHYGTRPEFVLLGGLVPDLLCSRSELTHSGTTDVDVQVNLEIAAGAINTARLERALRNAEFEPDAQRVWRWQTDEDDGVATVKFELLADLDDVPAGATVVFDGCEALGAANLRGTGFAVRDIEVRQLRARVGGTEQTAEINVTALPGFCWRKVLRRARDASRRTGTTSRTCCCTTMSEESAQLPQSWLTDSEVRSTACGPPSTICATTSPTFTLKVPSPTRTRWPRTTRRSITATCSAMQ